MEKKFTKSGLILLLFLISIGSIFSAIIPSNEPFRIQGNAQLNGNNLSSSIQMNGLVSGVVYKNFTSGTDGNFIVTLGGTAGNTASIAICGITANSTTFTPYSTKNLNFNLPLQADGITGCTCNDVCGSGTCSTPGISTGVCGISTTTTPTTSSSSGSIVTSIGTINISTIENKDNLTTIESSLNKENKSEVNDILVEEQKVISESLGIKVEEILSIQKINEVDFNSYEANNSFIEKLELPIKKIVKEVRSKNKLIKTNIKVKSKTFLVKKTNGLFEKITKISENIEIKFAITETGIVRIVKIIPKSVASNASLIKGNLTILENDPVVAFDIPTSNIKNNIIKLDYIILGDVSNDNLKKIKTVSVIKKNTIKPQTIVKKNIVSKNTSSTKKVTLPKKNTSNLFIYSILILLVIISIVVYFFRKKSSSKIN